MYSNVAGGVSNDDVANGTPLSRNPPALILSLATARQFEFANVATAVCEVVVNEQLTAVFVPALPSGDSGSMLIARTTNTSLSNGDRFRSIDPSVNVSTADSDTENPTATVLLDGLSPVGIPIMKGTKSIIITNTVLEHLDWRLGECGAKSHESRDKSPFSRIHIYVYYISEYYGRKRLGQN